MQMKNEAIMVNITHRDHTIPTALLPSFLPLFHIFLCLINSYGDAHTELRSQDQIL